MLRLKKLLDMLSSNSAMMFYGPLRFNCMEQDMLILLQILRPALT